MPLLLYKGEVAFDPQRFHAKLHDKLWASGEGHTPQLVYEVEEITYIVNRMQKERTT